MSADGEGYDSDKDFVRPKDEFMFYLNAFKSEERKMVTHIRFEEITAKYCEEMESEISQEWIMDSQGQPELSQTQLTKVLFRIAHQWCVNIDLDEYIDLLTRIFERIISKKAVMSSYYIVDLYQIVQVSFPLDEKKLQEAGGRLEKQTLADDWLECRSDESNRSNYDYKYEEDKDNMVVKKYKKLKIEGGNSGSGGKSGAATANLTIKDPFIYLEEISHHQQRLEYTGYQHGKSTVYYELAEMDLVYPFGYFAEQFFRYIKQDVYDKIQESKAQNKQNFANMTKEEKENENLHSKEKDTGLVEEKGELIEIPIENAFGITSYPMSTFKVKITDSLYNNLRKLMRDAVNLTLRMHSIYPKPGQRTKSRSSLNSSEPIFELNKFGYNPALERRVSYKNLPIQSQSSAAQSQTNKWINVNYMLDDPDFKTAYRCDVQRIETKGKMAIKDSEEIKKEEEFINVETTYKKTRQIMLSKKFESIYNDRAGADNKEQKRLKKLIEREDKRRSASQKPGNLTQKGLSETHEEKSFIKMMKGPFFQLDSKEGLLEDDFYTCAEQDLISAARTPALRILIIGKPRSGKTLLSKNLAIKLDLVHINIDNWIQALLTKIKNYEPPEDLEEGQEAPKFLTDLEDSVYKALQNGSGPDDGQIIEILREQIKSPAAVLKGYVLDLSFYTRESSWASTIRHNRLLGESEDGKAIEFSHIVELFAEDDDIKMRTQNMRVNPDDGIVYSRWEREERKKPKPVNEDEEQQEEDEENAVKPLDELALIQRPNDMEDRIREELQYYNTYERPAMEELLINFYDNQYIKIESAGLIPEQLVDIVSCRVKKDDDLPLRPLAIQIEGGGDYKSLLTEGLEENQLPRKWSLWKQTDPVALSNGILIPGQPENACHYNGNVFVFSSEENLKAFLQQPKKYIQERPVMPSCYRVLMLGPTGVGKHTQAQKLSDTYGWKIVDFKQLVRNKLEEMMRQEAHIPNNPMQGGRIGLSEQELNEVIEGKALPAWKYIPWIFDYLGYPLQKRPPPPPEEKQEEVEEEIDEETRKKREAEAKKKAIEEEKKRKEEEEIQKQKEERRKKREEAREQGLDLTELGLEESEEEPIIIEDLSIDQLMLKVDEETQQRPLVGGFILLGFPETEEQINRLKQHGLEFDRIIYLNDTNEEDPGAEVKKRMVEVEMFDYEFESENATRILGLVKEHLGEDNVREISCNGNPETVFIRLRNEIDPFYLKIDNPDDVRVSADLGEEDKKLPKGDFGDYCPVTYVQDNWLVRGNPEQEVTIFGKTYWLAGEKEAELFKFNPQKYLVTMNGKSTQPLQPPAPKIMILGHRGSGVTTLQRMLCEKFKLDEFNLKSEYLNKLKVEKEKRKRRRLLDRGFRPPQPPEEEGMEPPPDPEIEEDPDDFDKEGHEREVMKLIYDCSKGYVIDGTWRDLPEGAIGQNLQDLLFESRRVPEIVIILKCKEQNTFQRLINFDGIKAEYDRLMEARANERKRVREEERAKFIEGLQPPVGEEIPDEEQKSPEEIQAEIDKWDEERDAQEEAEDEADPEKPNLEEMLEKEREALREARTNDDAFFEEFSTALKDKEVFVIDDIKSDISADYVFVKLLDRIKNNFQFRRDLIERQLAQPLKPEEVKFFEASYIYKHSKYGINSPISLSNPIKTKKNAVLYRERLYFLTDQEQQQQFLKEPSKYTQVETIPLDISIKPKIFVIGMPKSGKSTLAKKLQEKTGIVHLKMSKVIQEFMDQDSIQGEAVRKMMKDEGKSIEDDLLISILLKRIQLKDCYRNGFILEDFPKTRNQALYLAKRGLVPSHVIYMRCTSQEAYMNAASKQNPRFGCQQPIFEKRLKYFVDNSPTLVSFYQNLYNNVVEINSYKSKWFIEDRAMSEIQKNLESRQSFARDYHLREQRACKIKDLHIDRCLLKQSVSEFKFYCPVTWKNEKLLIKCNSNPEDCVLYKNFFFFFKTQKERDMFITNPQRFIQNSSLPKPQDLPIRIMPHKAAEIVNMEKLLNGHCAVTLMDEERVTKGDPILVIVYKDNKYAFASEFKLQRFLQNPFKYSKASLPVKMPPLDDKVSLFNLQRMEDSIAFMEQALGQVVTRGLREVSENRLKFPTLSVKETMLKLFALFLKTENPANTESMKRKYAQKMKEFIHVCELPEEIYDLAMEKGILTIQKLTLIIEKKKPKDQWPEFKENYYNSLGQQYDGHIEKIATQKNDNFMDYIR